MSKKTKNVEIEGLGAVTLSALGSGWMEEHADTVANSSKDGATLREKIAASILVVHSSISIKHPDITLERIREDLLACEVDTLAADILTLSGVMGGAVPGNPSQGSSSAS